MCGWVLYRTDARIEEIRGIFQTEGDAEAARDSFGGSPRAWKVKAVPFVGWTYGVKTFGQNRDRYLRAV